MSKCLFELTPFSADSDSNIRGNLELVDEILLVSFYLKGDLENIIIPKMDNTPTRLDNLWQHTCFELFLSQKNSKKYWEFNLSPSGNWNIYKFSDYRSNMIKDDSLIELPISILRTPKELQLSFKFNIKQLFNIKHKLNVGICTVLELKKNKYEYWALSHTSGKPDFHKIDSFSIII